MLALLLWRGGGTASVVVLPDLGGVGGAGGGGDPGRHPHQKAKPFKPSGNISYHSLDTAGGAYSKKKSPSVVMVDGADELPPEVLLMIFDLLN